jgi:large subunit ribosomal protein L10
VIKGGLIGGEIYDNKKIEAYSKLPGKKDLISMLMSTMNATTSKLARTLQAVADKMKESAVTKVIRGDPFMEGARRLRGAAKSPLPAAVVLQR